MAEDKEQEKRTKIRSEQTVWWLPAITMFIKLSVWIAAPVIIALYLGNWLDKRFQTEPWLFLLSIAIAFTVSTFGLIKSTIKEYKSIEGQNKDLKKNQK